MRLLILLLTIFFSITIGSSQSEKEEYNAKYLIPYNDHGQWGFSDTLGNIKIATAYEEAYMFQEKRLNKKRIWYSHVKTSYGENILFPNGKLMLPIDVVLETLFPQRIRNLNEDVFLVSKEGKLGLFAYDSDIIVPTEYDKTKIFAGVFFVKKADQTSYSRFQVKKQKIISTDIVSFEKIYNWTDEGSMETIYLSRRKNGKYYTIKDGIFTSISKEEGLGYMKNKDEVWLEEMDDSWIMEEPGYKVLLLNAPAVVKEACTEVYNSYDYSSIGEQSQKFGFIQLYIAKRGIYLGILNEKGEEILPFQYEYIKFTENDKQIILGKDNKKGRKILFSPYPTIEPLYENLTTVHSLYVSRNWSFLLFNTKVKGHDVYVGMNGVDFFDLD